VFDSLCVCCVCYCIVAVSLSMLCVVSVCMQYDFVARHFIATVSPDAEYVSTEASFVVGEELFSATGVCVCVPCVLLCVWILCVSRVCGVSVRACVRIVVSVCICVL